MPPLAVTVLGHDRPGIIADATGILAGLGGNLGDSSMTLLRGHFAWTLVVDVDAAADQVAALLEPLRRDGLIVSVLPLPDDTAAATAPAPYLLTVHGADRPGIVSALTRVLAEHGGNITDLTTRLGGGMYVMAAEVSLPPEVDMVALGAALSAAADDLGVGATLRPADTDVL
jgi:glycine cleavage system transcriptional repressor